MGFCNLHCLCYCITRILLVVTTLLWHIRKISSNYDILLKFDFWSYSEVIIYRSCKQLVSLITINICYRSKEGIMSPKICLTMVGLHRCFSNVLQETVKLNFLFWYGVLVWCTYWLVKTYLHVPRMATTWKSHFVIHTLCVASSDNCMHFAGAFAIKKQ